MHRATHPAYPIRAKVQWQQRFWTEREDYRTPVKSFPR
jgi:hypothetical protein